MAGSIGLFNFWLVQFKMCNMWIGQIYFGRNSLIIILLLTILYYINLQYKTSYFCVLQLCKRIILDILPWDPGFSLVFWLVNCILARDSIVENTVQSFWRTTFNSRTIMDYVLIVVFCGLCFVTFFTFLLSLAAWYLGHVLRPLFKQFKLSKTDQLIRILYGRIPADFVIMSRRCVRLSRAKLPRLARIVF